MKPFAITKGGVPIAAWILKGDPKVFDIDAALDGGTIEDWSVHPSYRLDLLGEGQRCFLWRSGPDAALVAEGHVTGPVYEREANVENWEDQEQARRTRHFLPVELRPLATEVTRDELRLAPGLARIEVLRAVRMGNPTVVTPDELEVIEDLVGRADPGI